MATFWPLLKLADLLQVVNFVVKSLMTFIVAVWFRYECKFHQRSCNAIIPVKLLWDTSCYDDVWLCSCTCYIDSMHPCVWGSLRLVQYNYSIEIDKHLCRTYVLKLCSTKRFQIWCHQQLLQVVVVNACMLRVAQCTSAHDMHDGY